MNLTIYHTCDLHGRLTGPCAQALANLRNKTPASLLLDCGDALGAGNLNPGWGRDDTASLMREAGYDAVAMGNRETHLWWRPLQHKLRGLPCPVISSNVREPRPPVVPWLLLKPGEGLTVGIFALTPQMVRSHSLSARAASVVFNDPMSSASSAVEALRSEADVLVCLCHLGRTFDRRMAEEMSGIDIIIGGHDHSAGLPHGERAGNTLLARCDPYGQSVGMVEVEVVDGTVISAARLIWPEGCRTSTTPSPDQPSG